MLAVALPFAAVSAVAQDGSPFSAGCSLPFTGLAHPIDDDCGIDGKSTNADKVAESHAKNNFCATGPAVWATFTTFTKLRQATDASGFDLAADRSNAANIVTTTEGDTVGEGSLVKIAGFVLRAAIANKGGGENVNCTRGGNARNDLHIHLAKSKSKAKANFCKAVVAEVSPHQRPDDLNAGDLMLTEGIPVRITGHLLFDGNHPVKCDMNKSANSGASTWEIHPIYAVDVCKFTSLTTCDARNDARSTSLKEWADAQDADDEHP
jgi:hypothetical protein